MKKAFQIASRYAHQLAELKSAGQGESRARIGGLTIVQSTRKGKDGRLVVIAVTTASRTKIARETTKQIHRIVSSPISDEQRSKADHLVKAALDARASSITAKFRTSAA